ncbi:putative disease resistance protein, partial [Mucuna pruriens]
MTMDFSIFRLQHDIVKRIGVTLDEDDERIRAKMLSLALERKEKSVLILDDVWKNVDLQNVGIPLTSRLEHMSLISLLRGGCKSLAYVPPLEQLQALSRLGILGTSIEEVSQGSFHDCDNLNNYVQATLDTVISKF